MLDSSGSVGAGRPAGMMGDGTALLWLRAALSLSPDGLRSLHRSEEAMGCELRAPAILAVEVVAAIHRSTGEPELARQAVRQLLQAGLVDLAPVSLPLARRAAAVAAEHRLRGCDAVYVAPAEQLEATLITLDR